MKKIFSTGIVLLIAICVQAQKTKTFTITGKVNGETKGYDKIFYYTGSTPVDSVVIQNGKFKLKLPFTETYTQLFFTQYEISGGHSYKPFPLLIDGSGNINIEMDIEKGFYSAAVSGSKTAVLFHSFLLEQTEAYKKINEGLMKLYGKLWAPEKDPLAKSINVSRDSLSKLWMGTLVSDFVGKNKDLFVGVYVLNGPGKAVMSVDQLEKTLQSLSPKMQKTAEGEKLAAYIRGVRNTTIGAVIKNFVLNDPDGKSISFDQFKGKYVWIDFWASWCGPCKQAFPHMKDLYAHYKEKGFEIVGISTDTKTDPWLKILPKLQNPWPQLWDNKNIMSEFAVTAFPTGFLIGPDGKIIAKEIGFNDNGKGPIELKLDEIFGGAKTDVNKPTTNNGNQKKEGEKTMPMVKMSGTK